MENKIKKTLLLHICCIGCGSYVVQKLSEEYDVTLFFYNPNIFPAGEYEKRLEETIRIASKFGWEIIIGPYDHDEWLLSVKGFENEPERGQRCQICIKSRLLRTVREAKEQDFDFFATTLTISPHKNAGAISVIGRELAGQFEISYLDRDFKKQDGFKKTCALSRSLNLYRQDYCGCEFSQRKDRVKLASA